MVQSIKNVVYLFDYDSSNVLSDKDDRTPLLLRFGYVGDVLS